MVGIGMGMGMSRARRRASSGGGGGPSITLGARRFTNGGYGGVLSDIEGYNGSLLTFAWRWRWPTGVGGRSTFDVMGRIKPTSANGGVIVRPLFGAGWITFGTAYNAVATESDIGGFSGSISEGQWYTDIITSDDSGSGSHKRFLNGSQVGSTATGHIRAVAAAAWSVGANLAGTSPMPIDVCDITICSEIWDATKIAAYHEGNLGISVATAEALEGYWMMNDETDHSGNGNDATFTGDNEETDPPENLIEP